MIKQWSATIVLGLIASVLWLIVIILIEVTFTWPCSAEDKSVSVMPIYSAFSPVNTVTFGDNELIISWKAGIIDVKYGENVEVSEAADYFFDFLKRYIRRGYKIIPKERKK